MKKIIMLMIALIIIPSVLGAVEVTYNFNENNVTVHPYNCLNNECSQVGQFSGTVEGNTINNGGSVNVNDGQLKIVYPSTLQNSGYALFFTSPGKIPIEWKSTLHTHGHPGLAKTTTPIDFFKTSKTCRAPIGSIDFDNTVNPGTPLTINAEASLDATTGSAFSLVNNDIEYIPPVLIQRYYSVDTKVILKVLNGTNVLFTDEQNLNYTNGNALFAGTQAPVSFIYTPANEGNFTVKMVTEIMDPQCQNTENQTAEGDLKVLDNQTNYCFALLDNLQVNNMNPNIGEEVTISYDINAEKVGTNAGQLQAKVTENVENGTTVYYKETDLGFTPQSRQFKFTPQATGNYEVEILAEPLGGSCNNVPQHTDTQKLNVYVGGTTSYNVNLFIQDKNANPIVGAKVLVSNQNKTTGNNGNVTFSLNSGSYNFQIITKGYPTTNKRLSVNSPRTEYIYLQKTNTAPTSTIPTTYRITLGNNVTIDLAQYVADDHDKVDDLIFNLTHTTNILSSLQNNILTLKPRIQGTENVLIKINDTSNLQTRTTVQIITTQTGTGPTIAGLLDVVMPEDTPAARVQNLHTYTTDADTPIDQINYSGFANTTDLDVIIENDKYITLVPGADFNGLATVQINAEDPEGNVGGDTFRVNVTPINDAPRTKRNPVILTNNESINFTVDLNEVFYDVDNAINTFNYYVKPVQNITLIFNITGAELTVSPDKYFNGQRTFDVYAIDLQGLNTSSEFRVTIDPVNDAPEIFGVLPDLTFAEDTSTSIDLTAFEFDDEDGPAGNNNQLTWSVLGVNNTLYTVTINSQEDFLELTGQPDMNGVDALTLVLTDSSGKNVTQNITVNITPVNDAPVLHNIAAKTLQAGNLFTYKINATDVDNDTLEYYDNTTLFNINTTTGLINETINLAGSHSINITVCDGTKASNNCTWDIFVLTITDTGNPVISNVTSPLANASFFVTSSTAYTFSAIVTDNGIIDEVVLEFDGINYTNSAKNGSTYSFDLTNLTPGTYNYLFHANDTQGNNAKSNTSTWVLNKRQSVLNLTLNGVRGNISVNQNQNVNAIATLIDPTNGSITMNITGLNSTTNTTPVTVGFNKTTPGTYNVKAYFAGNVDYESDTVEYIVTVNDSTSPTISNLTETPVNGSLSVSSYTFSMISTDNMGVTNVTFNFNGQSHNVTKNGNVYTANINSSFAPGTYAYTWSSSDAAGNIALTNRNYKVGADTQAPVFSNEAMNPANGSLSTNNYQFSIGATDNVAVTNVTFEFNGTLINVTKNGNTYSSMITTALPAENYTYRWNASDAANNTNITTGVYTVIPDTISPNANNAQYTPLSGSMQTSSYTFSIDATDNVGVTSAVLEINGTNYTATQNGNTWTVTFGSLPVATHNLAWTIKDASQNQALYLDTYTVTPDSVVPSITWTQNPGATVGYQPNYTFEARVTDNVEVDTVVLWREDSLGKTGSTVQLKNGTNITGWYEEIVTGMTPDNYSFYWTANDTTGNSVNSTVRNVTIVKGMPILVLQLNGVAQDISVPVNDTVTIVSDLTTPAGKTIQVFIDRVQVFNNVGPDTRIIKYNTTGTHNVSVEFAGNANYTARNITRTITVIPPITKTNITPASGLHTNYSSVSVTVTTSGQTTCSWDANDLAQQAMSNTFTTTNGLTHTATVNNLVLGANNIYIACNNESANANSNLVYNIDNILDQSTLTGTNTITNTKMTSSTIDDSINADSTGTGNILDNVTATDSTINNSIISDSQLTNSTILDSILNNVILINAYVNPSNISASTINGGSVRNSEVTNSQVTNSNIKDSNIDGSTITTSTINNSRFNDATVQSATIIDDVISSGSITVAGVTYDATANGAENLSEVIPVPPKASFTSKNAASVRENVNFVSTSTDDNINALGDNLTYSWNFGDGSTSTLQNVTKKYTTKGTYTVTLKVNDSYGLQDVATKQITITALGTTNTGGGGGGGGGGSSSARTITINDDLIRYTLRMGQPLYFKVDGKIARTSIYFRKVNTFESTNYAEFMYNGMSFRINEGEKQAFDITGDGVNDMEILVEDITGAEATIMFGKPGETMNIGMTPTFSDNTITGQVTDQSTENDKNSDKSKTPQGSNTVTKVIDKTDKKEVTVDVEAEVGESFWSKTANKLRSVFQASASFSKWAVALGIIIVGLVGYAIAVRFMD